MSSGRSQRVGSARGLGGGSWWAQMWGLKRMSVDTHPKQVGPLKSRVRGGSDVPGGASMARRAPAHHVSSLKLPVLAWLSGAPLLAEPRLSWCTRTNQQLR